MEKLYAFAGLEFSVEMADDKMYTDARQLAPFEVSSVRDPHRFHFSLVDQLPAPTGTCIARTPAFRIYRDGDWTVRYIGSVERDAASAYIRAAHRGKEHAVMLSGAMFPNSVGAKAVLNCIALEHLALEASGVVFHSAYIVHKGEAILFTAPSGIGKSTQAELWRTLRNARIVNGDRSVLRISPEGVLACGIPFSGSSVYCENVTAPVKAVVYLGQAPRTEITELSGVAAFRRIWEGCSVNVWDKEDVGTATDIAMRIASSVPVFHLACTPDETAIRALESALKE